MKNLNRKFILPLAIAFSICLAAIGSLMFLSSENIWEKSTAFNFTDGEIWPQKDPNLQLNVELAETQAEQSQGLMDVKHMEKNQAMLFIFNEEQKLTFWMKDTLLALDIAFLDNNGQIIKIHHHAEPLNTSLKYSSDGEAAYVIETNAGWFTTNRIVEGDSFNIFQ